MQRHRSDRNVSRISENWNLFSNDIWLLQVIISLSVDGADSRKNRNDFFQFIHFFQLWEILDVWYPRDNFESIEMEKLTA